MKVVEYVRVSTEDKGQNPQRQRDINDAWALEHGAEIVARFEDIGTSASKVAPFARPCFMEAVDEAARLGADILVEQADRLTREGPRRLMHTALELEEKKGVRLLIAEYGAPDEQDDFAVWLRGTVDSGVSRKETDKQGKRIKSGMATAKRAGKHVGRPPKEFTPEEDALMLRLRAEGRGERRIAAAINEARGVHKLADAKAQRRRRTAKTSVRRRLLELEGSA